jgi:uncharacterized protein GlcG (DUF336 family)
VTRYSVCVDGRWLAAVYDSGSGIMLTEQREDACSWVTHEAAVKAARVASTFLNSSAFVHAAEEPNYPASWGVLTKGKTL